MVKDIGEDSNFIASLLRAGSVVEYNSESVQTVVDRIRAESFMGNSSVRMESTDSFTKIVTRRMQKYFDKREIPINTPNSMIDDYFVYLERKVTNSMEGSLIDKYKHKISIKVGSKDASKPKIQSIANLVYLAREINQRGIENECPFLVHEIADLARVFEKGTED